MTALKFCGWVLVWAAVVAALILTLPIWIWWILWQGAKA